MSTTALLKTYAEFPFELVSGKGVFVYDSTGKEYLDLYGGHAVCGIGHSHPHFVKALCTQAEKLSFYSNLAPLKLRNHAAEKLLEFSQSGLESVFFCNSGAEANENALKLSVKLTGRSKIVALRGGFHGRTCMAAAVTDNLKWHQELYSWMGEVEWLEPNDLNAITRIDTAAAAVIVEPILSIAGVIELSAEYLQALRARCTETGAMLILDEVQTGIGRTGVPFVSGSSVVGNVAGNVVTPDMFTSAKSLGSGFPVAALFVSKDIAAQIAIGDLGSTFGGGPLAMAAIIATLEVVKEENLVQNATQIGDYINTLTTLPAVSAIRGRGCLLGVELKTKAAPVSNALLSRGIICGTTNEPNVLRLLPPLTLQAAQIDYFKEQLCAVLSEGAT